MFMNFKITYDEHSNVYVMNGWAERFIEDHLLNICKVFGILEPLFGPTMLEDILEILSDHEIVVTFNTQAGD